jgi:putative dimethyl sulfoxide reductase chaperone
MPVSPLDLYFLSLCLLYPEPGLLPQLEEAAAATGAPWAREMAALHAAEPLEALQVEHTRLFVVAAGGVPCPPYESAYVNGQLLAATAAVAAIYADWGIEQALEMADYLPVELQFAAYLAELARQGEERPEVEAARHHFEAEHLRPWLPRFAADLQEHARLVFYRQVGRRLAGLAIHLAANTGTDSHNPKHQEKPL